MEGRFERIMVVAICSAFLLSLAAFHFGSCIPTRWVKGTSEEASMTDDVEVEWWFDPVSKAVCWDGRSFLFEEFRIDFDGDLETSITSEYVGFPTPDMAKPRHITYNLGGTVPGVYGGPSVLSEHEVDPPVPHFRYYHGVKDVYSEWYHIFVTKLDPPTDYVIGVQRSDGSTIIPLTEPFQYTEDDAASWHVFDPSVDSKGNRTCREDFPEELVISRLDIDPDTLNLESKGRWVTAHLSFENASVNDANISSILLEDFLKPERWDYQDDVLTLKFSRQELQSLLVEGDSVEIKISGEWNDGGSFEAFDTIRVIDPGNG